MKQCIYYYRGRGGANGRCVDTAMAGSNYCSVHRRFHQPGKNTGGFCIFRTWICWIMPFAPMVWLARSYGIFENVWYDDGERRLQGYRKYNPNEEFIEEWLGIFEAAENNSKLKQMLEEVKVFHYLNK